MTYIIKQNIENVYKHKLNSGFLLELFIILCMIKENNTFLFSGMKSIRPFITVFHLIKNQDFIFPFDTALLG